MPLPKRQIKHPAASCVGATADMMQQWHKIKLSLEDICDSESKKLTSDVIVNKICKNEERRINIEFNKETEEEILSGNYLSDMAINLAQLVIHKQFPLLMGWGIQN